MKRRFLALMSLLALTVGCVGVSLSGAGAPAPTAARSGAEIFHECLKCHSKVDLVQRGPRLEGLPAWYVVQQLNKFKTGIRGLNPENRSEALMGSIFQGIPLLKDDAEIQTVAEHIASLPPLSHPRVIRGDASLGKAAYQTCIPCHGDNAQGNQALKAPPLNVQEDYYLLQGLALIKNGDRGGHPDDLEARLMRAAMGGVDPTNFPHIIRYVADLPRTNAPTSPAAARGQP